MSGSHESRTLSVGHKSKKIDIASNEHGHGFAHGEHHDDEEQFSDYQKHILSNGLQGRKPILTVEPLAWEGIASKILSAESASYVIGGASAYQTQESNRRAFDEWKIIPRMLRKTQRRDITTTLFGSKLRAPVAIAPVGVQSIFHREGEAAGARAAAELGIAHTMSSASTQSIEHVAEANGDGGVRWYQLYWPANQDNDITISLLNRAKASGFTALFVTLDTWQMAWRPTDLSLGYNPFLQGVGDEVGFSDPVFQRNFKEETGKSIEEDRLGAGARWANTIFSGPHDWLDLAFLKQHWDGPIILKGIQSIEDAERAVSAGMDGIVVSNHAGRQVDGAIASLDVLPHIVQAVGDKVTVLYDSGIRTGADIFKALALGAKGVLIGRQFVYGLAHGGYEGVLHVMRCLLADFDLNMGLAGYQNLDEVNVSAVSHISEIHESHRQLLAPLRQKTSNNNNDKVQSVHN